MNLSFKSILNKLLPYFILTAAVIVLFFLTYRSWGVRLDIPYFYQHDSLWNLTGIKGYIENGTFVENKNIGAPFGNNYYDFPSNESLFKIIIFFFSFVSHNPVILLNLYYLMTFILTALFSYIALRYFKVSNYLSIIASIILTFLPYHIVKGTNHISLSGYFLIPLSLMVFHWIFTNQLPFKRPKIQTFADLFRNKFLWSIIIIILVANNGIYYTFFTVTFILVSSLLAVFEYKKPFPLLSGMTLIVIMAITVFLNFLPNIQHQIKYGKNKEVAIRQSNEAENYSLKIIELFTPVSNFNNGFIKEVKELYANSTPTKSKSEGSSYLGLIGISGFLILIINLFTKKSIDKRIDHLSYLNLWALILATISSLGTIIGYLISSQIRVYSRMSIFIDFFSIFALAILLDKPVRHYLRKRVFVKCVLALLLFIIVYFDQIDILDIDGSGINQIYQSDKQFIRNIERALPKNAMIFELPYKSFPETAPLNRLTDYDLFRGYINSNKLRWSYGVIKNTGEDLWMRSVSSLSIDKMLEKITLAGYDGLYIDRMGYEDDGYSLEQKLTKILGEKPIINEVGNTFFYNLTGFRENIKQKYNDNEYSLIKQHILSFPPKAVFGTGFYNQETDGINKWNWSKKTSKITLVNTSSVKKNIIVEFRVATNSPQNSKLKIKGLNMDEEITISEKPNLYLLNIEVPPGSHSFELSTDTPKVEYPNDSRELYFRIINMNIVELD